MRINLFGSIFCCLFITGESAWDPKWQFRGILPIAGSEDLSELTRASIELKIASLITTREAVAVAAVLKRPTTTTAKVGAYTMSPQEVISWIASTRSANIERYLAPVKSLLEGGLGWIDEIKKLNDEENDECAINRLKQLRRQTMPRMRSLIEHWKTLALQSILIHIWWDVDASDFLNDYVEKTYKRILTEFNLMVTSFEKISLIFDFDCATSLWVLTSSQKLHEGIENGKAIEAKGGELPKDFSKKIGNAISGAIYVLEKELILTCHFEKINKTEIFSKYVLNQIQNCEEVKNNEKNIISQARSDLKELENMKNRMKK